MEDFCLGTNQLQEDKPSIVGNLFARLNKFRSRNDCRSEWFENKEAFKNVTIIWLDTSIGDNDQIQLAIEKLSTYKISIRQTCNYDECLRFFSSISHIDNENIIVVVSHEYDQELVLEIAHLPFIIDIYRYSLDGKVDDTWAQQYQKVHNAATNLDTLVHEISRKLINITHDYFPSTRTQREYSCAENFDDQVQTVEDCEPGYQMILIDISKSLNELSCSMLKTLLCITDYSIFVFDYIQLIDLDLFPKKPTVLFISSESESTIKKPTNEYIKAIYILEKDKTKGDQRKRFGNSEDFIYQLADELYLSYKREAKNCLFNDNPLEAELKELKANQIHSELKRVYEQYSTSHSDLTVPTIEILVWLTSSSQNKDDIEQVQKVFNNVISSFLVFGNEFECYQYLLHNNTLDGIFLIINDSYQNSTEANFQQLPNVKTVYYYGSSLTKDKTHINNYNDLCSRLSCNLIAYYKQLGDNCNRNKNTKEASKMFMKAHELCKILGEL